MEHVLNVKDIKNYDLIVCGGGFTGVACAYQASKLGLKVALIESKGYLGGVGTSGNVPILLGGIDYMDNQYNFVVGGLFKKIYYDLRKENACVNINKINRSRSPHAWYGGLANAIIFDIEKMKLLLDQYILESNIDIFYFTNLIDVKVEKNEITYAICSNKSGIQAFKAKYFADCTGDADVAMLAGCEYELGRKDDNLMAPATLTMLVDNVNTEKYLEEIVTNNSPRFKKKIKELREKGIWNFPYDILISIELNSNGLHLINTIRQIGIDGTNGNSLTKGIIEGRKENEKLFNILKKYFIGFENAKMVYTGETIGIRETRRIKGEYTLKIDDLVEGKRFNDIICISSYSFDLPDPKKPSFQPLEGKENLIKNKYTQIPYLTLVPKQINNLICPGRAISVEREVLGPIRVMGPCTGMGQAAGVASYEALNSKKAYKDINIENVKKILKQNDCIINNNDICKVEEI